MGENTGVMKSSRQHWDSRFLILPSNSCWGVKWPQQPFWMIISSSLHSYLFGHFFLISPDLIKHFPGCFCVILYFSNPFSLQVMLIFLFMITNLHLLLSISTAFTLVQSTIISHLDNCYNVIICIPAFTMAVLSILHLTARVLLKIIMIKYDYTCPHLSFKTIQWLLIVLGAENETFTRPKWQWPSATIYPIQYLFMPVVLA